MYVSIFNVVSCTLNVHRRNLDALACSDSAGFRGGRPRAPSKQGPPTMFMCLAICAICACH